MKNLHSIGILIVALGILSSCQHDGSLDLMRNAQVDPGIKENNTSQGVSKRTMLNVVSYRPFNAHSITMAAKSYSVESAAAVKLEIQGVSKNIRIYKLSSSNYAYDLNSDGQIDFQMRPLSPDFKTVSYLDIYGNSLGKAYMSRSNNLVNLRFEEAYRMIMSNPS